MYGTAVSHIKMLDIVNPFQETTVKLIDVDSTCKICKWSSDLKNTAVHSDSSSVTLREAKHSLVKIGLH